MTAVNENLVEEAIAAYRDVTHSWSIPAALTWLALDLSIAQVKALIVLAHREPLAVSQIGDHLGIGLPTASHLTDRLVQAKLAERSEDPDDRRRTLVRRTERGRELTQQLWYESQDRLRSRFSQVPADDLSALIKGLRAIALTAAEPAGNGARTEVGD